MSTLSLNFHKASKKVEVSLFLGSEYKDFGVITPMMLINIL